MALPKKRQVALALLVLAILALSVYALLDTDLFRSTGDGVEGAPTTTVTRADETEPQTSPAPRPVKLSRFRIESEAVGRTLSVSVLEPPGETRRRRPLLVFLHGAGGDDQSSVADPAVLGTLARLGARAPVVAFPDGRMSWWRKRTDGDWSRYVVREVVPTVSRRFGTDPRRVAVGGISMGGFGAYHLGLTYPHRFCAVGGHSAGIYLDYQGSSFGAFDNPADFRRNNLVATVRRDPDAFGAARIWNDYGDADWFVEGNAAFVKALEGGGSELTARVWPGGHDGYYWSEHWPDYLRFYSRSLAAC